LLSYQGLLWGAAFFYTRSVRSRSDEFANGRFNTTHWSIVLACGDDYDTPQAQNALAKLFQTYWYPLYAYVRRRGYSEEDAKDLVQAFCAYLHEKRALAKADQQRGKFRTFLLSALQNFLANEHARAKAQKRGGDREMIFLDAESAHNRYRLEPSHSLTPEAIFETRWAHVLLQETLTGLRADCVTRGKEKLFDELASFLTLGDEAESYQAAADRLHLPLSAIKTSVHRLRQDYREKLREEISRTVSSVSEIDEEFAHLRKVLAGSEG
jgi:RNA polymerase sigma factor (sigma-70 family)